MDIKRNKLERLDLSKIKILDNNIKEHDIILFEKLKTSIKKRGQLHNIVVCAIENEQYECLSGSKTVKALRELGDAEVFAINLGVLSKTEKNLIRIEISKDYFLTDYVVIGKMLKQILSDGRISDVCSTIPFDNRQVEKMISMTDFDWEDFNDNKQIDGQVSMFDIIEETQNKQQDETIEKIPSKDTFLKELEDIKVEVSTEEKPPIFDLSIEPELSTELQIIIEKQWVEETAEAQEDIELSKDNFIHETASKTEPVLENINKSDLQIGDKGKWNGRIKTTIEITKLTPKSISYLDFSDDKIKSDTREKFERLFEIESRVLQVDDNTLPIEATKIVDENDEVDIIFDLPKNPIQNEENLPITEGIKESNEETEQVNSENKLSTLEYLKKLNKETQTKQETVPPVEQIESIDEPIEINNEIELLKQELATDVQEGLLEEKIELNVEQTEEEPNLQDLPFYVDSRKVLVVQKFKHEILLNLPFITKNILENKWQQSNVETDKIRINQVDNLETGNVEITHILYVSPYGVRFNMTLSEICEMLNKIDFEPQDFTETLF